MDSSASGNRYAGILRALSESPDVELTLVIYGGYLIENELEVLKGQRAYDEINFEYTGHLQLSALWGRRRWHYFAKPALKKIISLRLLRLIKSRPKALLWITIDEIALDFCLEAKKRKTYHNKFLLEVNEFNNISNEMGHNTNLVQRYFSERENKLLVSVLGKIDGLLVMTHTLMKHFKNLVGPQTTLFHLPMTVDIERFTPKSFTPEKKNVDPYVGFIGSFSNSKEGIDLLIEAFSKVREKYPEIKLRLAGGNHADVQGQKELIKRFDLESTVQYIGSLGREEVPPFLEKAKVLVMARPLSKQAEGGFPTKLGEYLATSNPVVVTRVGEIRNYLEDKKSCFFAEPGDVDSLVNALCCALEDTDKPIQVGEGGRQVAETTFNAKVQADRLLVEMSKNLKSGND